MPAADLFDLTVAQRDIWLEQLSQGTSPLYNIGAYVALEGQVDRTRLTLALHHLASLHDALRTVWVQEGGSARQRFAPQLPVTLMWDDLQADAHPTDAALNLLDAWMRMPIALEQGPLWEARLIRMGPRDHLLALRAHHLVLDGWGVDQWFKQLADLYLTLEHQQALPGNAPSYCAFIEEDARYRASARYQRDREYWLTRLAQLPDPLLRPTQPALSPEHSPSHALDLAVTPGLMRKLRALADTLGVSPLPVLLGALHVCVCRTWQRDQWMVGLPVRNRANAQFKATLGLFTQVSPLRMDFGRNLSFADLIQAIVATLKQDFRHQRYPLSALKRDVAAQQEGRTQLFELLVSFEEDSNALQIGDVAGATVMICNGHEPSPLSIHLRCNTHAGTARLHLVHSRAWFSDEQAKALGARLLHVLEQGLAQPQALVSAFDMLTAPEHQRLRAWNMTAMSAAHTAPCLIQQRIELQARTQPGALAACFGDQTLSYGELDHRASALAQHLASLGVGPERRVAVVAQRGLDTLVGLLAVLKAGGAYVPVDPAHPAERIAYLLQDSAPHVVLTLSRFAPRLPKHGRPQIELDDPSWPTEPAATFSFSPQTRTDLVYIIYTSGSTGQPKGVMVEQRMLANLVDWHCTQFALGPGRHQSSVAGFGFDAMAWEIWPALCSGATLHLAPVREGAEDVHALLAWWRAQTLHVSFLPTPIAELAFAQGMPHPTLETLLVGGDRLRRLGRELTCKVINNYGPTEATVVATSGQVQPGGPLHIGVPVANTQVYVLDGQGQLLPPGAAGELYIGGQGVARGYFNQPQLSAERFVQDPFSSAPGARLYRTGDWVRWLSDGTLEYLGRNDDQVKIRGMRVELAEIEAALSRHPAVNEGVVMLREGQLHAWFTATHPVTPRALHDHLRDSLPVALLPVAYMQVAHWPLTANGKLDRRALPPADDTTMVRHEHEPPEGEMEQRLAALWAQLLHIERIGRHDHFFELGGHSLLAVQLIEGMRQQGLQVDVQVLFGQSTLAAVAASTRATECVHTPPPRIPLECQRIEPGMLPLATLGQAALDRIVARVPGGAANVQEIYPLAPLQQGLLYHHLTDTVDPYQQQAVFSFATEQQVRDFAAALQHVMQRHDILRTAVHWECLDEPVQVVWREAALVREALPFKGHGALTELCDHLAPRHYRLDLRQAPLMQLAQAQGEGQAWVAVLTFHHMIMDHTALDIVRREIQAHLAGTAAQLPAPTPFRNFLAAARQALDEQAHTQFFEHMLADIDEPTLAFGAQAKPEQLLQQARLTLPTPLARRLRQQARLLGVSPASVLHLGFARWVGQLAGRQTVVFGSVLLGRMTAGEGGEQALGMFINTLPLRIDVTEVGVKDGLLHTHRRLTGLLAHEQASLALAQRCSGVAAPTALFNSMLNYRHSDAGDAAEIIPVAPGIDIVGAEERTDYPLTVSVDDLGDDLRLTVQSLPEWDAARLSQQFEQVLANLVHALEHEPDTPLQHVAVLPPQEFDQVVRRFNDTACTYRQGDTVHARIQARARVAPEAIALRQDGQVLSYAALNQQANQLAHWLLAEGVEPGQRIALCLPRNANRLVGMLAVLKAGAAYVPVDPAYPADRIAYLLTDSAPAWVLAESGIEGLPTGVPRLDLDHPPADAPTHDPVVTGLDDRQLAYLVYTSGSTGQPKGVMVEHRALVNLVDWHCQAFELDEHGHASSVAGFGFDALAWEVWPCLCAGATLHLPPADVGNEHVEALLDWWLEQPLTVSFLPTPVAEHALRRERQHPTLRTLLVGGDRLRHFERDPGFALVNNYGPTETTVVATSGQLRPGGALHIGTPIANTQVYVLDAGLQPVPVGVVGELYIGGAQVARGYFNRPELTHSHFINDPFSDDPQARLYRSGDLVRWNTDGTLDYLGRNDDQVKIRGVRVELGEIEAALKCQPGVEDAVVLVRDGRLLGWYTQTRPLEALALREALQACLPAQLVPAALTCLDALPLTRHGKLDRRALPTPDTSSLAASAFEAPHTPTETAVAAIWADVLQVDRVGRHDNFFELG
ncbi:MAG TPA: non-ribosomal peptide synthetase, partial [Pseudomonas sp.]|nr:non-ribosomal peptide synthetase [Pseudomonas sp.]